MEINGYIGKKRLISKFMASQPGKETHNAQYLEKYRRDQTMEFGQLIKCNMRNIFLKKSYTKRSEETIPRPFSKKSKLSYVKLRAI